MMRDTGFLRIKKLAHRTSDLEYDDPEFKGETGHLRQ